MDGLRSWPLFRKQHPFIGVLLYLAYANANSGLAKEAMRADSVYKLSA